MLTLQELSRYRKIKNKNLLRNYISSLFTSGISFRERNNDSSSSKKKTSTNIDPQNSTIPSYAKYSQHLKKAEGGVVYSNLCS